MKKIITIFFILFSFSAYSVDIDDLTKKADSGDVDAQYNLGNIYYRGLYIPENDIEATKQYKLLVDKGTGEDQYFLYSVGQGIPRNYMKAFEYYKLAAEQGNSFAQCKLAVMYQNGEGTQKDLILAKKWYKEVYDNNVGLFKERCHEYQQIDNN